MGGNGWGKKKVGETGSASEPASRRGPALNRRLQYHLRPPGAATRGGLHPARPAALLSRRCAGLSSSRHRSRASAASRAWSSREGLRAARRAVPLPRGAGSRGPRSRPPLAWPGPEAAPHGLGLARGAGTGARSDMGKKHKKHKSDRHFYEGEERPGCLRSRAASARKAPTRRDPPAGRRSTRACRPRRVFVGRWEVGRPPSVCPRSARALLLFQSTWRSP